jgi:hypothetical protein
MASRSCTVVADFAGRPKREVSMASAASAAMTSVTSVEVDARTSGFST